MRTFARAAAGGSGEHSIDDGFVAGATADISGDRLDHLGSARRRVAVEQGFRGHQHAWRAVTALRGEILRKSALKRMQVGSVLDPIERFDGPAGQRSFG
jgi:hypothetical protein